MRARGSGTVINVTSLRQVFAWPSFGQNTAAQAALALITETLRLELEPFEVDVVEVIQVPIETAVQGPTKLIPGIVDAIHGRLGTATPEELADKIVEATVEHRDRVFCPRRRVGECMRTPSQPGRDRRRRQRVRAEMPANELIDTLVVGADHPLIQNARRQWEEEQGDSA